MNIQENPIITIENGSLKGGVKIDYQGRPFYSFQGIPYAKPPIGDLRFKSVVTSRKKMNIQENPIITIENGSLRGSVKVDYQGRPYYSFQGIPYAKPPIGDLRFKAPQSAESWIGVRDSTKEGDSCYSRHLFLQTIIGSEDCLFLNVYTPQIAPVSGPLKPVMVWIHGGAFIMGSGNTDLYGPNYLISEDVVLVTINYRYGLLGFLSFDDVSLDVPGNAGLKDQVMALKWVKQNIAHFGGDPNNVTIFGQSAGGVSVHYLILSSLAKGLFHKAIIQSGAAFTPRAQSQKSVSLLRTALGMENATEKEIYEVVKGMAVEKLFEIQEKTFSSFDVSNQCPLGPVIENIKAKSPFLVLDPVEIIKSGNYNHVPIIIGFNSREGMVFEIEDKIRFGKFTLSSDFEKMVPYSMKISQNSQESKLASEKIQKWYFGTEQPSNENIDQYYLLQGDIYFVYPIYLATKLHNMTSKNPIYLYRMSIESKLNILKQIDKTSNPGASHGDDIGYLFSTSVTKPPSPNSTEDIAVKRFIKLWTTFAKTGNPNLKDDTIINVDWKPVKTGKHHFLNIGDVLTTGLNPYQENMKLWEGIRDLGRT